MSPRSSLLAKAARDSYGQPKRQHQEWEQKGLCSGIDPRRHSCYTGGQQE
jgi:hypothetical protein